MLCAFGWLFGYVITVCPSNVAVASIKSIFQKVERSISEIKRKKRDFVYATVGRLVYVIYKFRSIFHRWLKFDVGRKLANVLFKTSSTEREKKNQIVILKRPNTLYISMLTLNLCEVIFINIDWDKRKNSKIVRFKIAVILYCAISKHGAVSMTKKKWKIEILKTSEQKKKQQQQHTYTHILSRV